MVDPPSEEDVQKEHDAELRAGINRLEGTVKGLKQFIKDCSFQFGEDHSGTMVFQQDLDSAEERLRELRHERRSGVPIAELRRRAEKDRDTAFAKLERTNGELKEVADQQDKLNKRSELLGFQQAEQTVKLEKLKAQVAELAQDEIEPGNRGDRAGGDKPQHQAAKATGTASEATARASKLAQEAADLTANEGDGLAAAKKAMDAAAVATAAALAATLAARKAHSDAADRDHIRAVAKAAAAAKAEEATATATAQAATAAAQAAAAAAAAKRQQDEAAQEEVKKARLA
jgi:colicin import membrane protein